MKIVLATSNKGKVKEIAAAMRHWDVSNYSDFIAPIEIEETGNTFKENAIIKAKAISKLLPQKIILADDSGLSVPKLNNEPGLYSARYAGENASDGDNVEKLCNELNKKGLKSAPAFYTACIAVAFNGEIYTSHGFCYGAVLNVPRGNSGFGYDPIFIPNGYDITFGEMDEEQKLKLSHRTKGLELIDIVLKSILK